MTSISVMESMLGVEHIPVSPIITRRIVLEMWQILYRYLMFSCFSSQIPSVDDLYTPASRPPRSAPACESHDTYDSNPRGHP